MLGHVKLEKNRMKAVLDYAALAKPMCGCL